MTNQDIMTPDELFDSEHFISNGFDCYTGYLDGVPSFGAYPGIEPYPCGYIALPLGHKFHGMNYHKIMEYTDGLMCSGLARKDGKAFCSTAKVKMDGSWFIGFDMGSRGKAAEKSHVIEKINDITNVLKEYN